ncbi:MAG TPA: AtpZ/AtpI family protein [Smithella sp.]|nr:AtpZ/AtpI family protein [Smithella sp.]MDM7986430.1 AtpZ/AtpI family protein [Smithella sp.]HNY50300.1 AtpZ/AtpI family protein [Smithella sp.]HOG91848.1 AtpZ/AtpI family protein [Smithella sp.]HOU49781.1 AtpZ/AtpI family protein [Smithella sp.]
MKGYLIGKKPKANHETIHKYSGILMLSAWGVAMVASSLLFLYIGYIVDELLGTTPKFMLSSFFVAVGLCFWKLYYEAREKGKKM